MRKLTVQKICDFFSRDLSGEIRSIKEYFNGSFLPYLSITTSTPCPLKCKCCPWEDYSKASNGPSVMSLGTFEKILSKVPREIIIEFDGFTEPCINPEMPDMVVMAKSYGHSVQVFSTLIGLSDVGMEKISSIKLDKFCVHVPDKTNTIYDTEKWIKIVKRLKEHKFNVITFGALGNVDQRILQEIDGYPFFQAYVYDKNLLSVSCAGKYGQLMCTFNKSGINLDQNCVSTNGNVCICPMDYKMENVIGNLLTQTYDEIMNSPIRREFRRRMLTENELVLCRHCPYSEVKQ